MAGSSRMTWRPFWRQETKHSRAQQRQREGCVSNRSHIESRMSMNTKTFSPKTAEIERRWWLVDAEGQTLGRLASLLATRLRGKDKPTFSPHMDVGDFVIVVNASRIQVTGRKLSQKQYYKHSGYPGGLKTSNLEDLLAKWPDRVIEKAVRGMLPQNKLGDQMIKKLKVYGGMEHPHSAQTPEPWVITTAMSGGSEA